MPTFYPQKEREGEKKGTLRSYRAKLGGLDFLLDLAGQKATRTPKIFSLSPTSVWKDRRREGSAGQRA